jgi:hypothetical protein
MNSNRISQTIGAILMLMLTVQASGCGGAAKNRPPMAKVSGKVLYNGEPLANATVVFQLADQSAPRRSEGLTDSDGSFTLTTYNTNDGAFIGSNVVTVTKQGAGTGQRVMTPADLAAMGGTPPTDDELPGKFADPKTSGLKFEVESGNNDFEISLKG